MYFSKDKYLTLDDSATIEVYSGRGNEFIFSMPLREKEIKQLKKVLNDALKVIETERNE